MSSNTSASWGTKELAPASMVIRSVLLVLLLFGSLLPGGEFVQMIAAVLLFPVVLVEIIRPLVERLYLEKTVIFVVAIFGALLIPALMMSPVGAYGHEKLLDLATLSIYTAFAAMIIRGPKHLQVFAYSWISMGLLVAIVILTGEAGIAGRATGAGANPIGLARAIAISAVSLVWLAINQRVRLWLVVTLMSVYGVAIFSTGSKGPVLGAGIACLVLVLVNSGRRFERMVQLALGALAGYAMVLTVPFLRESRLGEFVIDPFSIEDPIRSMALIRTVSALQEHGLTGHGYGSWSWITNVTLMEYPHNIWAELAIEAGVATCIIVFGALVYVMARLIVNGTMSGQLVAAWLAAETVSASLSGDIRARAFWFFLVLGFAVVHRRKEIGMYWTSEAPGNQAALRQQVRRRLLTRAY